MAATERPWPKRWPEFLGKWPRLTGRQQPEVEVWHPGDESEGDAAAKFGLRIGLRLLPWEWMVVRAILSLLPANEWGVRLWTHRNVVIECTRQQGKTLILILIILWKLFKRRRRVVYTAQQWATVEDVFDRVCAIIDRVPSLKRRLARPPSKKDNRGVILLKALPGERHVVKADFGPRTQHFARGFTEIDDLILDEAYDLVPKETANLTGAQAASDNPQTIYASTPPVVSEHPNCGRFAGFVRTILAGGAPGLYGALYRAPKTFTRGDIAAYPLAQPSYGVVGDDREMEAHLQGARDAGPIDLALFDADWLGWGDYPPPPSATNREISADGWKSMGKTAPVLIGAPVVALERAADPRLWLVIAAWRTADSRVHIEVRAVNGSDAVAVEKVSVLVAQWNPDAIAIRAGTAAAEVQSLLVKAGVEPEMVNQTEVAQFCGGFLSAALDGRLSHSNQPELDAAVSYAVKRDLPRGAFVWELVDEPSYPALMGASTAHGALLKFGIQRSDKPAPPMAATTPRTSRIADFDAMSAAF